MSAEALILHKDCIQGMGELSAHSVDFVFADLPYGVTQNDWDIPLRFDQFWCALRRVCKPDAVLVFTAVQPFASKLVCSNELGFQHEMIRRKNRATGHLNAKHRPLRAHENILVFCHGKPAYAPTRTTGHKPVNAYTKKGDGSNYGAVKGGISGGGNTSRLPTSVLDIAVVSGPRLHPTQKPVALPAFFIEAYSKPGDLVLDPTAGSGTTGVAALQAGRRFIGFDTDLASVTIANQRLQTNDPSNKYSFAELQP